MGKEIKSTLNPESACSWSVYNPL